tara:strand:+ start:329 stop:664 length:336 start_codon:yes stop_codon:yes gene_type:complete
MRFTVCQINKDRATEKAAMDARILGEVDPVFFLSAYEEVAAIEADTLDEVFEIGNIGPEEKIERFDRMHSISVGDVIRNDKYECYVVAPCGFERLGMTSTNGRQWFAEEIA